MNINPLSLLRLVVVLSVTLIAAGVGGMVLSFLFMSSTDPRDLSHAGLGFIAGAIFIGSGLMSSTIALSALSANSNKAEPQSIGR
ncbi:hypothetical protein V2O64_21695 [Verrucomicrobiaceae bacterium 227]